MKLTPRFIYFLLKSFRGGLWWELRVLSLSKCGMKDFMNHVFVVLRGVSFDGYCGEFSEWGFALVLWEENFDGVVYIYVLMGV